MQSLVALMTVVIGEPIVVLPVVIDGWPH